MNAFERKITLSSNHFEMVDNTNRSVSVTIDQPGMDKLKWLSESSTENVFSHVTKEWELFFGPYIDGAETGYIFQVINMYSRRVASLTVEFDADVNMNTIKNWLKSVLGE